MFRKTTCRAMAVALTSGAITVLAANSAQAAPHYLNPPSVQIGYADSATPRVGYDWAQGVNLPLGTRVDEGVTHTTRVYASYDLSQLAGKKVIAAAVTFREAEAADCTKRSIEIWQTKAISATPSWNRRPAVIAKVAETSTAEFCPGNIGLDVSGAVAEAVRRGKTTVSFEIRVRADVELDPTYYRALSWYNTVQLRTTYNAAPVLQHEHMYHGGLLCTPGTPIRKLSYMGVYLQALSTDTDADDARNLQYEFAVRRGSNTAPPQIYTAGGYFDGKVATVRMPDTDLVEGQTYFWQYRTGDGLDWTKWSRTCRFKVDLTAPSAPTVSSSNYPPIENELPVPVGEPGIFTFSGNGDTDIIGFEYYYGESGVSVCGWGSGAVGQMECPEPLSGPGAVAADVPGGTATALVNAPSEGENVLKVRSIDAAGNRSPEVTYTFHVPYEALPGVAPVGTPEWGESLTLRFSSGPGVTGTTHFTYTIGVDEPQTVAAQADGTATISFLADNPYGYQVAVTSHSANGWISPKAEWWVNFYPWPTVTSDVYRQGGESYGGPGIPGTFTFTRPVEWTEVAAYRYAFNDGTPIDIPADANSRASVTWAPEASGWNWVDVWALDAQGNVSDYSNSYWFSVA